MRFKYAVFLRDLSDKISCLKYHREIFKQKELGSSRDKQEK